MSPSQSLSVPLGGQCAHGRAIRASLTRGQEALGTEGGGVPRKPLASGMWRPEQCGVPGHAGYGQVVMAPGGGLYAASHSVFGGFCPSRHPGDQWAMETHSRHAEGFGAEVCAHRGMGGMGRGESVVWRLHVDRQMWRRDPTSTRVSHPCLEDSQKVQCN